MEMNQNDVTSERPPKRSIDGNCDDGDDVILKKSKSSSVNNNLEQFSLIDIAMDHITKLLNPNNPIILDAFQKDAMEWLEKNHSVFVSAPTSAGKTLIAKFAIFKTLSYGKRIVITAPTKALCNQHFHDFNLCFDGKVGLITADDVINSSASCIVMITEVLRKMVYQNDAMVNDIGVIVFDEIHYMRNLCRGSVYEECIIHLADKVQFLFLSATVLNAEDFADWISSIQNLKCKVVRTDVRPVPLNYYIVPYKQCIKFYGINNADKTIMAKDFNNAVHFREEQIDKNTFALDIFAALIEKEMFPCIFFSFRRDECDDHAEHFIKNYGMIVHYAPTFLKDDEKEKIEEALNKTLSTLSNNDKELPQVKRLSKYVRHGIGVHHAGLLPILKKLIETLFNEGSIKVIFATDTLAMGINMPAKSVIFTSISKGQYEYSELIQVTEFIQMSGRAGRRGKDKKGNVIIMDSKHLTEQNLDKLLIGQYDPIISQFRIKNTMVLNLLSQHGCNAKALLQKTFAYYLNKKLVSFQGCNGKEQELRDLGNLQNSEEQNYTMVKKSLREQIMEKHVYDINNNELFISFNNTMAFLKEHNYLNADNTLTLKGKIASQIYIADGIFLTEMLSTNFFENFDTSTLAALVSCINYDKFDRDINKRLQESFGKLKSLEKEISKRIKVTPDINNGRMMAIYSWVEEGKSFKEISALVDDETGKVLESLRTVHDLLGELEKAAAVMGNADLQMKFADARTKMFHGIIA